MPNIWAHIQFGKEVLRAISTSDNLALTEWKTAFQLGCQGPDFLFYDHYLPWQKSTALNQLGNLMHSVRCGPFLLSLFEETRDRSLDDPASAYALGFLLHHALDRNLHPFVFSRSGFRKWHHQRYETAMDSQLLLRRDGLHTGFTPVAPEIDTQGRLPGDLSSGFLRTVAVHYPALAQNITADQLDGAVAQFQSAQRLFYDPSGWKGRLTLGHLAPFSPPRRTPEWDVLNEARQTWIDPSDRTVVHQASALELWDLALEDGRSLAAAVLAWKRAIANNDGAQAESRLKSRFGELLGDVSYETGLPCGTAAICFAESVVPS